MRQLKFLQSPKVQRWLYNTSSLVLLGFFAGFSSVLPIDAISQASRSTSNYALNTFVVVGALVLFGVTAASITSARIYSRKQQLQDIPKRYVPIDENDLPKTCYQRIQKNFQKCEEIRKKAMFVNENIKHPGLSSPNSTVLPPSLSFDDIVRAVGMKLKWDNNLVGTELIIPKNLSFREIVAYLETKMKSLDPKLNREFVELYEDLRYSGKLITEEKFIKFMEFSIDFVKTTKISVSSEYPYDPRRHHSGSHSYAPSEISRSTFDGISNYSMNFRSNSLYPVTTIGSQSLHPVMTTGSQSMRHSLFGDDYVSSINDYYDPLYRPTSYSSVSSTATTARRYER